MSADHKTSEAAPQSRLPSALRETFMVIGLASSYVVCSAVMVFYNKYILQQDRFPFPMPLVLIHTVVGSVLTYALFLVCPSLFPALSDPEKRTSFDSNLFFKGLAPIAVLFSLQLVLNNAAFLFASLAFLRMMKGGNIVIVYAFSFAASLEHFSWCNMRVLFVLLVATVLTIRGELHFSLVGCIVQGVAQICESAKLVVQALVFGGTGRDLDVLTYTLVIMPICSVLVAGVLAAQAVTSHATLGKGMDLPAWPDLYVWWPQLVLNALVATVLNLQLVIFVKYCSPLTVILSGLLKDALIVIASCALLGEHMTLMQSVGFALQVAAVSLWSMMKMFPAEFENGAIAGLWAVVIGARSSGAAGEAIARNNKGYGNIKEEQGDSKC